MYGSLFRQSLSHFISEWQQSSMTVFQKAKKDLKRFARSILRFFELHFIRVVFIFVFVKMLYQHQIIFEFQLFNFASDFLLSFLEG